MDPKRKWTRIHWWNWWKKHHHRNHPINPKHPKAPVHHPLPPGHKPKKPPIPAPIEQKVVYWCHMSLKYAGKMTYTEDWKQRQQFFSRKKGGFMGASADCSQFVATILHWLGVTSVTSTDYTGTLLQKGHPISAPKPGCVAVWGPGTGTHTAFITEKVGSDWYCVGFGHQGAPDRVTLSAMNAYFASIGKPGVRYLTF